MARQRKEPRAKNLKLRQPDRSGPQGKTLLDFANERHLFAQADERRAETAKSARNDDASDDDDNDEPLLSPMAERILEAALWTVSLAMLHFTFDVLVHHQYGRDIRWGRLIIRAVTALVVFIILFWPLHPHVANRRLLPGLPPQYQEPLRQAVFFAISSVCGCYLIYITNSFGYLAIMKQAPPLGCLWVWSVVEMHLLWAVGSLVVSGLFLWQGGYSVY